MNFIQITKGGEKVVLCTPLMEAVKVNHTELVKLLIDNGAQVGTKGNGRVVLCTPVTRDCTWSSILGW